MHLVLLLTSSIIVMYAVVTKVKPGRTHILAFACWLKTYG